MYVDKHVIKHTLNVFKIINKWYALKTKDYSRKATKNKTSILLDAFDLSKINESRYIA